ncbi:hypothetical protein [Calidifontibacillus erzurumensis]|uniref:hypothetical protein n=1 Tax=Calidifontibacillus erzurumensis TaxID=2741433 RepID=UPI0035B508EC
MSGELYFIIGSILLAFVLLEILKRIKKKPLTVIIAQQEKIEDDLLKKEKKKREKEYNSFYNRAKRVNWNIPKNYQQTILVIFSIIGGVIGFILEQKFIVLGGIAIGLFYPYLQLRKKEEIFQNELPLRAEQAINAVEQQLHGDITIFDALKAAVPFMQSPFKEEYGKAVEKVEKAGIPLKRAVSDIPARLGLPQLEYFHMILEVAEETEEKASEIIRDASDLLRRQQKKTNEYNQAVADSKKEMKMMFILVVVMVVSFMFLLPDDRIPFAGSPIHRLLDMASIGITGWVTWSYLKKLQAKNLFL